MHRKVFHPLVILLGIALLCVNAVWEWPYAICFTYSPLNNWSAAFLAISFPASLIFLGRSLICRANRIAVFLAAIVLAIPALLFAIVAVLGMRTDELQDSLTVGRTAYRIYMRDPGVVTSQPFTILRKEIDTHLGIKLVRTIWSDERYGAASLRLIDQSTLEVAIDGDFYQKRIEL